MTSAQVLKTSVNVITNSPSWDHTHLDNQTSMACYNFNDRYLAHIQYTFK